jgi:hypothetical protein
MQALKALSSFGFESSKHQWLLITTGCAGSVDDFCVALSTLPQGGVLHSPGAAELGVGNCVPLSRAR